MCISGIINYAAQLLCEILHMYYGIKNYNIENKMIILLLPMIAFLSSYVFLVMIKSNFKCHWQIKSGKYLLLFCSDKNIRYD